MVCGNAWILCDGKVIKSNLTSIAMWTKVHPHCVYNNVHNISLEHVN
jgi:hypothetical protein